MRLVRALIAALCLAASIPVVSAGQTAFGRLGLNIPQGTGGAGSGLPNASNVTYLGSFSLSTATTGSASGFQFAGTASRGIAYSPTGNGGLGSLYIGGAATDHHGASTAEVSIPGTGSNTCEAGGACALVQGDNLTGGSTNVASLPRAKLLVQTTSGVASFYDITNGAIDGDPFFGTGGAATGPTIGGLGVSGSFVYGSIYSAFGPCVSLGYCQQVSMWRHGLDLSASTFFGWETVQDSALAAIGDGVGAGTIAGTFALIPASLQSALGGSMFAGLNGVSIVSRTSYGVCGQAFSITAFGSDTPSTDGGVASSSPIAAKALVCYPNGHHTLGDWGNNLLSTYVDWNEQSGGFVFFHGALLVPTAYGVGHAVSSYTGTDVSTTWYGPVTHEWQYNGRPVYQDHDTLDVGPPCANVGTPPGNCDPVNNEFYTYNPDGGEFNQSGHGPGSWPYKYRILAYDQNDLIAVKNNSKNAWDLTPYAAWDLPMPFDYRLYTHITATFDETHGLLYVLQPYSQDTTAGEARPLVHVYHIS